MSKSEQSGFVLSRSWTRQKKETEQKKFYKILSQMERWRMIFLSKSRWESLKINRHLRCLMQTFIAI